MAGKNGSRGDEEGKTGLITKTKPKTKSLPSTGCCS